MKRLYVFELCGGNVFAANSREDGGPCDVESTCVLLCGYDPGNCVVADGEPNGDGYPLSSLYSGAHRNLAHFKPEFSL